MHTLRFEDLEGDPDRFGALAALGPQDRIAWAMQNLPRGVDVARWLGDLDRSESWVGAHVCGLASTRPNRCHVIEHLVAGLEGGAAHALLLEPHLPEWVLDAAFGRLLALTRQGALNVVLHPSVRDKLLCSGAEEPGRWQLLQMVASEVRAGEGDTSVGDALCAELCDPASSDQVRRKRAVELLTLASCAPNHSMVLRWGVRVASSGLDLSEGPYAGLAAALFAFKLPWERAATLGEWLHCAASSESGVLDVLVEQLCASSSAPDPQLALGLSELVLFLASNPALTEDSLLRLAGAFPATLRGAVVEGLQVPAVVLASLINEHNLEELLDRSQRDVVVPFLLRSAPQPLVAQLAAGGWLVASDAALMRVADLASLNVSHSWPLLSWVADRLGDRTEAWRLFAELADGDVQMRVGDLLAMVDVVESP